VTANCTDIRLYLQHCSGLIGEMKQESSQLRLGINSSDYEIALLFTMHVRKRIPARLAHIRGQSLTDSRGQRVTDE
jgi:hypothetical protein